MPHITVQMFPGRNDEIKMRLAKVLQEAASKELNRGAEHFSVSIVDVPQDEWKAAVYDKVKTDPNTFIQPGYDM